MAQSKRFKALPKAAKRAAFAAMDAEEKGNSPREFHNTKDMKDFVSKNKTKFFATTTTKHSTWVETSLEPKDGYHTASRILKAIKNKDY